MLVAGKVARPRKNHPQYINNFTNFEFILTTNLFLMKFSKEELVFKSNLVSTVNNLHEKELNLNIMLNELTMKIDEFRLCLKELTAKMMDIHHVLEKIWWGWHDAKDILHTFFSQTPGLCLD